MKTLAALAVLLPALAHAQSPLLSFTGPDVGSLFGRGLDGAGDVNNDGYDDIVVGAWMSDVGALNGGSAWVRSGYDGEVLHAWHGTQVWQNLGGNAAGMGDLNGDGWDDVAVSAARDTTFGVDAGAVFVYSGKTGSKLFSLFGTSVGGFFGVALGNAGDVNNDGKDDIIVGADATDQLVPTFKNAVGAVKVFSGANGAQLFSFMGTAQNASMGRSVDGAGDVDGDGRDDFLFTLLDYTIPLVPQGRVEVRSGVDGHLIFARNGTQSGEAYGYPAAAAGDVNNDGLGDIVVGAAQWNSNQGRVEILLGPAGQVKWALAGDDLGDFFGGDVTGVGDIDKDGHDDVLIGAYGVFFERGAATLYSGRTGTPLYSTLLGDEGYDHFGGSVAGLGDTNGDGWVDFGVGADEVTLDGTDGPGYVRTYDALVHAMDLGFGGPGSAHMEMYGSQLDSFGQMDLVMHGAAANKPAWLVASATQANLGFKGGILVPNISTAILVPVATDGTGSLFIPAIPGGGGFVTVYLQCAIQDPAQVKGWALSNAIRPVFLF